MYETYEELVEKKLGMIDGNIDKRQGSIIFDAIAPNAAETAKMYTDLLMLEERSYGDTATGIDLTRRVAERGIIRKSAIKAVLKAEFYDKDANYFDVSIGDRFAYEDIYYTVISRVSKGIFLIECEKSGKIGNYYSGEIMPVGFIEGLTQAVITEIYSDGEDEEDDETLRKRYMESFNSEVFGGNISDYKKKVKSINVVGGVKVYPIYYGGGTVRIVFTDRDNNVPKSSEIETVQKEVDPDKNGMGNGIAPIGHIVTVEGARGENINISMKISYQEGFSFEDIQEELKSSIEEYFLSLRSTWDTNDDLVVRISYIESRALQISGILDITDTAINGMKQNIVVSDDAVPVLGEISEVV